MEIVRHIKIKYFPPNKEIYAPSEWSNGYYFILRGKVLMGVNSETSKHAELLNMSKIEKKTTDYVPPVPVAMLSQQSGRSQYKQLSNIKNNLDKDSGDVFFEGRVVKLYV